MVEKKERKPRARKRSVDPITFAKAYVENDDNATMAFEATRGKYGDLAPGYAQVGAHLMMKKPEVQDAIALVKSELNNHAMRAVQKVGELVESENEVVAGQNARFIIEHVKGKAMSQQVNTNINIYEAVNSLVMDVDAPEAEIVDVEATS